MLFWDTFEKQPWKQLGYNETSWNKQCSKNIHDHQKNSLCDSILNGQRQGHSRNTKMTEHSPLRMNTSDYSFFTTCNFSLALILLSSRDFPGGAVVKNLPANAGDTVRAVVGEDPTCCGATKPVRHNYRAWALEPVSRNYWACVPQLLKPTLLGPVLRNKRSHRNEKPAHRNEEWCHN